MLFALKPKKGFVNQNKEKITLIVLPWGRVSLVLSERSGSFELKTVANKIVKNALRVEINQFCDG